VNYAELRQKIIDFAETDEGTFVDNIDNFIKNAEQKIYNAVQIPALRKNVTGITTQNNKYLSSPSDFLSVFSLAVIAPNGEYEYLLNKDVNFIRQVYPSPTDTGKPRYYAIFGPTTVSDNPPVLTNELSFILGPTPDAAYAVELHYFFYPESIVTAGTTWLGDNFDTTLFYGAMREASIFQRMEVDVVANYEQKYNEAMTLLKQLGDGKQRQDSYRSGQVRYPVG
jgi:hypothetical protein